MTALKIEDNPSFSTESIFNVNKNQEIFFYIVEIIFNIVKGN